MHKGGAWRRAEREGAAELENASDSAVLAVVVDENVDDASQRCKEDDSTVELSSDGKSPATTKE